ncbi:MAG TPA: LLM class flavin-dependent oxidoreductase [Acidimicrobiales bacterium]|jgi:alkanesulfonate monooxygenase SsuD/methylene tetrahydromethanopterin reductase-like flavin-dependent oxidoreductase (luciferase family)|nr:LLM class flavin-dependent oxidoreductase [Acidimicrobiales bacterium]
MNDLTLLYDMRAPDSGAPADALYRAAVEQCAWADTRGFTGVTLTEHHATSDGYLPSPMILGAAVAGSTQNLLIRLSLVLLPLYHPLRAAEDLAVLDLISGGRLRLTVGLGYRPEEYEQLGVVMRQRPSLMEEAVETLKSAWTGEPFEYRGRTVRVLPRPAQRPRPLIAMGGASPASARRAARIADDYQPLSPKLYDLYLAELAALGRAAPQRGPAGAGTYLFVSEDPDRDWARIAPHAVHDNNEYASWIGTRTGAFSSTTGADELRRTGPYRVVTPDECLAIAAAEDTVAFKPLVGGLDPEIGWEGLHLFADKVLPHLQT